ncbi:unnamed protein product [Spirodela intermedia]|uniref:Uncharacterized protein n=1 Tax=Spirodela intermedia TaxID=51605 RepID=A0A7I8JHQ0_SPIIN|nr:unnamed protein product [Spirodela intermedia]CAA6669668.1 unnamed protein product [Spirodela intermedia]
MALHPPRGRLRGAPPVAGDRTRAAILAAATAGLVGSFRGLPRVIFLYLIVMLVLVLLLAALVVFVFSVTGASAGHPAPSRAYLEYHLEDYSGCACLRSTRTCSKLNQTYPSAQDFFSSSMNPLQSGCCKPPTECGFTFVSATNWISPISSAADEDCGRWSNDQTELCYSCSSCKAGLLEGLKKGWRRAGIVLLVVLVLLVFVHSASCYAFRRAKTEELFRLYKQGYT